MKLHSKCITSYLDGVKIKKTTTKKLTQTAFVDSIATFCAKTFSPKVRFRFILSSKSFSRNRTLCRFAVKQVKHTSWPQQRVFFYLSRHPCLERPSCLEAITAPYIYLFHLSNIDGNVAQNTPTAQGWLSDLSPTMSETQRRREKLSRMRNPFGAEFFFHLKTWLGI